MDLSPGAAPGGVLPDSERVLRGLRAGRRRVRRATARPRTRLQRGELAVAELYRLILPVYRIYSPVTFEKKWDPRGDLIRKLRNLDARFIHE